jgi:hypothetical protein
VWLLPKPRSARTEPSNAIEDERRHDQAMALAQADYRAIATQPGGFMNIQ